MESKEVGRKEKDNERKVNYKVYRPFFLKIINITYTVHFI